MTCKNAYHAKKFHHVAFHEAVMHSLRTALGSIFIVHIYPEVHPVPPGGATLGWLSLTESGRLRLPLRPPI